MTGPQGHDGMGVARLCALMGLPRASYYRAWAASAPRVEETALRDLVQRLALQQRFYGYRRITALVRREGWSVNHKEGVR